MSRLRPDSRLASVEPIESPVPASATPGETARAATADADRCEHLRPRGAEHARTSAVPDRALHEARTGRRHWHPAVPGPWAAVPAAARPFGGGRC